MRQNLTNIPTVDINDVDHLYIVGSTTKSGLLEGRSNVKVDLKAAIGEGGSAELSETLLNRIIYSGIADAVSRGVPKEGVLALKDDFLSFGQIPEGFEIFGPEDFYGVVMSRDGENSGVIVRLTEEDYNLWSQNFDAIRKGTLPPMPLCFPITDEIIIKESGTFYDKGGQYIHQLRDRYRVIDNVTENKPMLDIGNLLPILGTTDTRFLSMVETTIEETISWEEFVGLLEHQDNTSLDFPFAVPAQYSTEGITSEEKAAIISAFDSKKSDYRITVSQSTLLDPNDFFVSLSVQETSFTTIVRILKGNVG